MATTTLDITHWIGGRPWSEPQIERWGEVFDPATGERQARVAFASRRSVDAAVGAGAEAQPAWGAAPVADRVAVLRALGTLLRDRAGEVAELVTAENGKPLQDAAVEVARGLEAIDAACAAPPLLRGAFTDQVADGVDSWTLRRPLGVCVGVTPASYPVMVPLAMAAPALVAGNAFVLKPAEEAPSPAMLIAELLHEAGLPGGVFNVAHGDRLTLDALLDHPAVEAVAFAGPTDVARYVRERAAAGGRRCRTLTGAKSHVVVLPDADLDAAADAIAEVAYRSDCQRCSSITTALAVGAAGDPLVAAMAARAQALTVGPGADAATRLGPLTSARARDRVVDYVERAVLAGAELVVDGRGAAPDGHAGGFFVGPCLFDGVSPAAAVRQDDTGGPVVLVVRVSSLGEALAVVREDPRAGGAALFTRDPAAARRFQRDVVTGQVGINVPMAAEPAFGDPLAFYTRSRVVTARWDDAIAPNGGRNSEDRQMVRMDARS